MSGDWAYELREQRLTESLKVGTPAAKLVCMLREKACFEPQGENWRGICRACGRFENLLISDGSDGAIVMWCANGCGLNEILAAIGEGIYNRFPDGVFKALSAAKGKQHRNLQYSFASLEKPEKKVRK